MDDAAKTGSRAGGVFAATCISTLVVNANTSAVSILLPGRQKFPDHPRGFRAPMLLGLCGVGFAASLAALLVGFIPPSQFASGNPGIYVLVVGGGALGLGLLVPFLFYRSRKPSWK
ncbi:hypothetical protein ACLRGH_13635 [Arthrobacter koreensis]